MLRAISVALPVPALKQVVFDRRRGGVGGFPENGDFAWEVCQKWEVGDVEHAC